MADTPKRTDDRHERGQYAICLGGHLDERWAEHFGGMRFSHEPGGTTTLTGPVADQTALHGLLRKVRDLGLPLISVLQVECAPARGPALTTAPQHSQLIKETTT